MSYSTRKKKGLCHLCGKKTAYGRVYCNECAQKRTDKARSERRTKTRTCRGCGGKFVGLRRRLCDECSNPKGTRFKKYQRDWRIALKREAFDTYGGAWCACCREDEFLFLSLDHVDNNGSAHRKEISPKDSRNGAGVKLYAWLKRKGFPPGFQVLCMNCNFGKKMNGGICPHKHQYSWNR